MDCLWHGDILWQNLLVWNSVTYCDILRILWQNVTKQWQIQTWNFSKRYLVPECLLECFWDTFFSKIYWASPRPPPDLLCHPSSTKIILKVTEFMFITDEYYAPHMWQKLHWCDINRQKVPKKLWQFRNSCDILKIMWCDKSWLAIKHESILCVCLKVQKG